MGEILKLKKNPVGEIWCGRDSNLVRMRTTRATSARSLLMVGTSVHYQFEDRADRALLI